MIHGISCLLYRFYIKPQLFSVWSGFSFVVYYIVSTSNHNGCSPATCRILLSIISFLHQTTTDGKPVYSLDRLSIISFLHQTTTVSLQLTRGTSCLLYRFYIKPQLLTANPIGLIVVYYIVSTSNHNCPWTCKLVFVVVYYIVSTSNHNSLSTWLFVIALSIISFLHQTTTDIKFINEEKRCLLYRFYIKPQPFI